MRNELDIVLDRLVPGIDEQGDWGEVLSRAGVARDRVSRRGRVRRAAVLAAGLATAGLIAAVGLLATRTGTGTASAAQVRAKLTQALSSPQSISGEYTVETRSSRPVRHRHGCFSCRPATPAPSTFVIGADGSYAERTLPRDAAVRSDVAYDAATGVETSYEQGYVRGLRLYVRATGLDPAWPGYSHEAGLAAWVRQALASRSPHVRNAQFEDRPAWTLTLRFTPADDFYRSYGVRVDVIVDRATGLVLQLTRYADSPVRWTSIESIRKLKIGAPTKPGYFEVRRPAGARAVSHDYGFRRVAPSDAATIVGYRPLVPAVAGGRPFADYAVAKVNSLRLLPRLDAPVYRDVVSARYGRGLDSVVVSTRRGHVAELPAMFQGISARTVTIARGPLAGEIVYLSTSPANPGYLAGFHDGLIVQVFASSAREAVAIASSLRG